eukprot:jgi/Picre1/36039/NNA_003495.t1
MREKLTRKRNEMIEELLKRDETFKPPADYRPEKKSRKIFIPYKEYPDANFIGLIIGPRGNTQKRMQEETNTRIDSQELKMKEHLGLKSTRVRMMKSCMFSSQEIDRRMSIRLQK